MARVEATTNVATLPEDLWKLVATSEGMSAWFVESVIEPGTKGSVTLRFGPNAEATMPIQIWDPPHRFRFGAAEGTEGRSHDITIGQGSGGGYLSVIDDGVPEAEVETTRQGWAGFFGRLKVEAETREAD